MTPAFNIVLRELLAFEEHLVELRGHARALEATHGTGDAIRGLAATLDVRRGLKDLAATLARLRVHVVAFDGPQMGDSVESTGELSLRATTIVVTEQLHQLSGFDDVASSIRGKLGRINGAWMCHSSAHQRAATIEPGDARERGERRFLYRQAIRDAQRDVAAIGNGPDVAPLLRAWEASTTSPEVRMACSQIVAALRVRLDAELDPESLEGPWRRTAAGGHR